MSIDPIRPVIVPALVGATFTDHSTPTSCRCGERDLGTSHAPAVAQPDPGGEAGSGLNFQEAQ